jgi:hypothetical protein
MTNENVNVDSLLSGDVATRLLDSGFDTGVLRPYKNRKGQSLVTLNAGRKSERVVKVNNAATLRKDEWIELDRAIMEAAMPKLQFFNIIRRAMTPYTITNILGKTVLQYQRQSQVTDATVSMDGLRRGDADRVVFDLASMSLPIIHKDFSFSSREIEASRNMGSTIDTLTGMAAAEKTAEMIERLAIGSAPVYNFAGGNVFGMCNYPDRMTASLTAPVMANGAPNAGWNPTVFIQEILKMKQMLLDNYLTGPFGLFYSADWELYLDGDYGNATGVSNSITLRGRMEKINNIQSVDQIDLMPPWTVCMVRLNPTTIRSVVGMDLTTVQWASEGGFKFDFKVMAVLLPQIRSDFYGKTGIVHGTAIPQP